MSPNEHPQTVQTLHSAAPAPQIQPDPQIDIKAVSRLLGVSRATLYTWLKDEKIGLPQPIRMGPRLVRFSTSAIVQFLHDKATANANAQ